MSLTELPLHRTDHLAIVLSYGGTKIRRFEVKARGLVRGKVALRDVSELHCTKKNILTCSVAFSSIGARARARSSQLFSLRCSFSRISLRTM